MSVKRKCVCCGKEYDYCPGCPKKDQPAWMATFCSEPCKELFNIVSAYNTKRISIEGVRKYMTEHGITSDKYVGPVKKVLDAATEVTQTADSLKRDIPLRAARKTEETRTLSSPIVRPEHKAAIASDKDNFEHRSRRNKKRRNRPLDIDSN